MLEAAIERAVVEYARSKKVVAIKLSTNGIHGTSGWPDRLFLAPERRMLWIEFKQPGKVPTPRQEAKLELLRWMGWSPQVVDSVAQGKALIDNLINGAI